MIVPTTAIRDWRDLQSHVAALFREMGYETITPFTVSLAGRGQKEVDVFIKDPRASVNQIMLVECKFWESSVPQDTVHSFHTVMIGAGANTGFIISKQGFQSGAYEATQNTNIHLLTWEELQHKFGRQWYLHQSDKRDSLVAELRNIDYLYLDQTFPGTIHNTMFFTSTGKGGELWDILANIRVALFASMGGPKTYDSGPVEVQVYEGFPGSTVDKYGVWVLTLADAREFFNWFQHFGRCQHRGFETLSRQAHEDFDKLPDHQGDAAMTRSLRLLVEESPIRTFRDDLGEEIYDRLIAKRLAAPQAGHFRPGKEGNDGSRSEIGKGGGDEEV